MRFVHEAEYVLMLARLERTRFIILRTLEYRGKIGDVEAKYKRPIAAVVRKVGSVQPGVDGRDVGIIHGSKFLRVISYRISVVQERKRGMIY